MLTDYIKDVHTKGNRLLGVLFLIFAFVLLYIAVYYGYMNILLLLLGIGELFIALYLIFSHKFVIRRMRKTALNLHNGKLPESVFQFSENMISLQEGRISMEFEYSQIQKIREYNDTIVLMIGKKHGLALRKDSFSIGTFEEFQKFLEKRLQENNLSKKEETL